MRRVGFGPQGMVEFEVSSSQDDKSMSGFEELALPLFDSLYNFARVEQLPIAFREVILLCDVEDASYREISEVLSIPIGTVMSRLARARKAVRESLSRCAPEATNNLIRSGPREIDYAHRTQA